MMDVIGVGVGVGAGAKKDATDVAEDSACSAIAGVFFFLRSRSPMRRLKQRRCVKLIGKMSTEPEDEELFPSFHHQSYFSSIYFVEKKSIRPLVRSCRSFTSLF